MLFCGRIVRDRRVMDLRRTADNCRFVRFEVCSSLTGVQGLQRQPRGVPGRDVGPRLLRLAIALSVSAPSRTTGVVRLYLLTPTGPIILS